MPSLGFLSLGLIVTTVISRLRVVVAFTTPMAFGRTDSSLLATNAALTCAPRLTVIEAGLKLILGVEKMSSLSQREQLFLLPVFDCQAQVSLKGFKVPFSIASLEDTMLTSTTKEEVGRNKLLNSNTSLCILLCTLACKDGIRTPGAQPQHMVVCESQWMSDQSEESEH